MPIEVVDLTDEELDVETPDEGEAAEPDKQAPPAVPAVDPAMEARLRAGIVEDLLRLANPNATASQKSHLESALEELLAEGVTPGALKNFMKLSEAQRADQEARMHAKQAQENAQKFDEVLWQNAVVSFDEIAKHIPILAKAGKGLRDDLLIQMAHAVDTDATFATAKAAIRKGEVPGRATWDAVAAKVIDTWCAETGTTKPSKSLSIKNSKPADAAAGKFDYNALSKGAKQIYEAVLKATKDPKKAELRARQAMAE